MIRKTISATQLAIKLFQIKTLKPIHLSIYNFSNINIKTNQIRYFCTDKDHPHHRQQIKQPLTPQTVPKQYLQIAGEQTDVGSEHIAAFHTKDAISILDSVPGTRNTQSGQLYVLMFTCTKCETKSIRSFTKNAYHKGVVLIRCGGCQNIHLVADNLGWFEDNPTSIETMNKDVKKVHDPIAIAKFLKAAFGK